MRTRIAVGVLAFLSFVACTEATSPTRGIAPTTRSSDFDTIDCSDPDNPCVFEDGRGLPPPPFRDTMAVVLDQPAFSDAPAIRVQYFVNNTSHNGWIMFRAQTSDAVLASPNAKISYHNGTLAGKGTLQLVMPGAVLSIDLAKNLGRTTFNGDCSKTCGTIAFRGATLTPKVGKPSAVDGTIVIAPALVPPPDRG